MEQYIDYSGHGGFHEAGATFTEGDVQRVEFGQPHAAGSLSSRNKSSYFNANMPPAINCDIKPRLTKEQHDILEAHFQNQHKPNTNTKRQFAENLGVSLDKVNNWFQNRRAKSKQEVKKQNGTLNMFQNQHAGSQYNLGSGSDSDPSPSFTSPGFQSMMQQWASEPQIPNGMAMAQPQQFQEQRTMHAIPLSMPADHFANFSSVQHLGDDSFNSPEMNRRTMTQEQFDAMARNGGGVIDTQGDFGNFQTEFSPDSGVWTGMYTDINGNEIKPQEAFAFPNAFGAPMSSYDSTVPSTISDQSMPSFPSSNQMQSRAALSTTSSEWSDSRSSSICVSQPGESTMHPVQQPAASTAQWQPGQSVPVDFSALDEEFRQARERQQAQINEQPLAWPSDDAYARRDSQAANMLAQGMSNVGIHTPQPAQSATFKSPAPPANIAARRQRRPAPIGLAAMRSQSYGGVTAPPLSSPGQMPQNIAAGQQIRRIRSSNMINGGVAHGRVMKSGAQKSPLSWTFADALSSPRHVSGQSNLAPPTPMTPHDFPGQESAPQYPSWHASSGNATRHPSINETDVEHELPYQQSQSVPPQNFSSPPRTPSFYQQQFVQQRVGSNGIMENTPPQSAPASQLCFPSSSYSQPPPQLPQHQQSMSQPFAHPPMIMPASQPPQSVSPAPPSQPASMQVTFAPTQHAPVTSGPPPGVALQFANGVPMVDDEGNITMAFPAPMQFLPEQSQQPLPMQQMQTPPQQPYPYYASATASPNGQITAQPPQQSQQPTQELFVHEYTPPEELKRSATPRKTVDSGPKNYTFANHGPDHFEKQAKKAEAKAAVTATNSPAASIAGSSTSAP